MSGGLAPMENNRRGMAGSISKRIKGPGRIVGHCVVTGVAGTTIGAACMVQAEHYCARYANSSAFTAYQDGRVKGK